MPRFFLFLLALMLVAPLGAQDDASLFFDTVDVFVVNVEVLVTDKDGNPATGLQREDFEVYEDGKRVDLTHFFAVEGRQSVLSGGTADIAPAPETQRMNLVVFVDYLNMRPQSRNPIIKELKTFLRDQFDSRDRIMLVAMNDDVQVIQGFTNNIDDLLGALERVEMVVGSNVRYEAQKSMYFLRLQRALLPPNPAFSSGGRPGTNRTFEGAMLEAKSLADDVTNLAELRSQLMRRGSQVIAEFTNSLAGMRGRKAILYLSDGLPTRPADSLAQAWINKFSDWITLNNADDVLSTLVQMTSLVGSSRYDTSSRLEALAAAAAANRVSFYPISPGGRSRGAGISAEYGDAGTASGVGPNSQEVVALESLHMEGSLLDLAERTGGLAFTRTTNVGGLLERMKHDFDSFYSLGYNPKHGADGEFHEVEVKVKRPGLKVRHFKGYREKDPLDQLQDLTLSALHYDLVDNQLEIRLDPGEQTPGQGKRYVVSVMVKIPFEKLLLVPQEEFHTAKVSLFVIARDAKSGAVSPFQKIDLPIQIPNAQILQALTQTAAYPLKLEMEAGHKRIAIGVRDHLADIDSTVNLDLEVGSVTTTASASSPASR